jgi:hypothetical protein
VGRRRPTARRPAAGGADCRLTAGPPLDQGVELGKSHQKTLDGEGLSAHISCGPLRWNSYPRIWLSQVTNWPVSHCERAQGTVVGEGIASGAGD